jgi:hypothetical protein
MPPGDIIWRLCAWNKFLFPGREIQPGQAPFAEVRCELSGGKPNPRDMHINPFFSKKNRSNGNQRP